MNTVKSPSPVKHVVLIGGGHAHVAVIRSYGLKRWPNTKLTVISKDVQTPYSGMLPGWIAGHYQYNDCHINLQPLCQWAGVRLIHDEVIDLKPETKQIVCKSNPAIHYDATSLDTGSQSGISAVPGAESSGIGVKPIDSFMDEWLSLCETLTSRQKQTKAQGNKAPPFTIAIVGGGAAGVEVCLAMQHRLRSLSEAHSNDDNADSAQFILISSAESLLESHNQGVQRYFQRVCAQQGIDLKLNAKCIGIEGDWLQLENTPEITANFVVWALPAQAQHWLSGSGLSCDSRGFVSVNPFLQSHSHPEVFAAGDNASLSPEVAKSGVYAVRQGPILAENLHRFCTGKPLKTYKPQRKFLSLISTGSKHAIASRGSLAISGKWLWWLKDTIDSAFMRRYRR